MILTDESRAKAAATRAATQAAKLAERAHMDEARRLAIQDVEERFPLKSSVKIVCPGDVARNGKYGKVSELNTSTAQIEVGVRVNVANPKKVQDPEKVSPGPTIWYLPSELRREVPPRHQT